MTDYFRHKDRATENVDGAFYAVSIGTDCGCELPESEAPTLLKTTEDHRYQTYFYKQPETEDEITAAINAVNICGIHNIRYGGKYPAIIKRIVNGQSDYIINKYGNIVLA